DQGAAGLGDQVDLPGEQPVEVVPHLGCETGQRRPVAGEVADGEAAADVDRPERQALEEPRGDQGAGGLEGGAVVGVVGALRADVEADALGPQAQGAGAVQQRQDLVGVGAELQRQGDLTAGVADLHAGQDAAAGGELGNLV